MLGVAYEQTGPISGDPLLLLHGFPYDVREFDVAAHRLTGGRVILPYLRGFGPTRYRSRETNEIRATSGTRKDIVDLPDALDILRP
jgi:pimeloyl-ACP methyl ester carboxylesterase